MATPSPDLTDLAEEFASYTTHLTSVAYRLTGSVSDAEDAVSEAWLRLSGLSEAKRAEIENLQAWLTTVVGRISLDRLRSAAARREHYVGEWLPEPVAAPVHSSYGEDPLETAVREEGARMAAMVVLDRLPAEQRVAFVLHDAFSVPFVEIADLLGCTATAARQYASRGRRAVADAAPPPRASMEEQHAVLERLMSAIAEGDIGSVAAILHPDAVLIGDADGKARTTRRTMVGADKISRFFTGLRTMYAPGAFAKARPMLVNGDLGIYLPPSPAEDGYRALDAHLQTVTLSEGMITAIYDIANPDKLARVPEA